MHREATPEGHSRQSEFWGFRGGKKIKIFQTCYSAAVSRASGERKEWGILFFLTFLFIERSLSFPPPFPALRELLVFFFPPQKKKGEKRGNIACYTYNYVYTELSRFSETQHLTRQSTFFPHFPPARTIPSVSTQETKTKIKDKTQSPSPIPPKPTNPNQEGVIPRVVFLGGGRGKGNSGKTERPKKPGYHNPGMCHTHGWGRDERVATAFCEITFCVS